MNPAIEAPDLALAHRYGDAWNAHDLDEIMSMQIAEMEFELKSKLVASKHTYMDAFALRSQLGLGAPEAAAAG